MKEEEEMELRGEWQETGLFGAPIWWEDQKENCKNPKPQKWETQLAFWFARSLWEKAKHIGAN